MWDIIFYQNVRFKKKVVWANLLLSVCFRLCRWSFCQSAWWHVEQSQTQNWWSRFICWLSWWPLCKSSRSEYLVTIKSWKRGWSEFRVIFSSLTKVTSRIPLYMNNCRCQSSGSSFPCSPKSPAALLWFVLSWAKTSHDLCQANNSEYFMCSCALTSDNLCQAKPCSDLCLLKIKILCPAL